MINDERRWRTYTGHAVKALIGGAAFGAATALVNALCFHYADFESRTATTSGWSPLEIVSVLLDSGWAWAGLAVFTGWLVTRAEGGTRSPAALARGAVAAALALLAATAAYFFVEIIQDGAPLSSLPRSEPVWWVASVVLGGPLGAVGACVTRPGPIGLLARVTVPVGAAVQMVVLPPAGTRSSRPSDK